MSEQLKHCPFCGGAAKPHPRLPDYCTCPGSCLLGAWWPIRQWNRRAPTPEGEALLDRVITWETASGLVTSAGDPDGLDPDVARKYWEQVETERNHLRAVVAKMRMLAAFPPTAWPHSLEGFDEFLQRQNVDPESLYPAKVTTDDETL